ncbi:MULTISPECIES: hypothetical protein [Oscillospiraceae]|uniref:Uncharacterized protein n=1 Tax=Harryflintia acetispora TaxID=1849041 RepID=A0A9X8Y7X5_9FIRM|nr:MULTISPECIES: hypothetical protein [Oscillospiraceae]TCL42993.1 hypothetical protein EDD78_10794 [Harryflintia acetispora]
MPRGPGSGIWCRTAVMFGCAMFLICFCPIRLVLIIAAFLLILAGVSSWRC